MPPQRLRADDGECRLVDAIDEVICDDESLCSTASACSAGKCSEPFVAHGTRCDTDLSTPDMGGTDVAFCREDLCQRRQLSVGGVETCRLIENDVLCWFGGDTRASDGVRWSFDREIVQLETAAAAAIAGAMGPVPRRRSHVLGFWRERKTGLQRR